MDKQKIKTVFQNLLNFLFTIVTLIWMIIVVILIETNQTISGINRDAKYFFFPGFVITLLLETLANYFHYISKKKISFKLEITFRIFVILTFITFIIGAIMYTNGNGDITSIF